MSWAWPMTRAAAIPRPPVATVQSNPRYLDLYDCCPCCGPDGKCAPSKLSVFPHAFPCPTHPEVNDVQEVDNV